ncbi:30S ribosomal protein S17 [Candidatus Gracilibacteria bacterium CG17_big_fil_post_rev_8_21_14_2_50_48_13]|nr:MAG: 30S ribosomal protein S17 [Candidatus Gracilibacteria bacterium CG17_big_fil_post_rev_8_21_14_2_50_48_13]
MTQAINNRSRVIKGVVHSNKMDKTIVVRVDSYKTHPIYKKRYRTSKKFYAHDEGNKAQIGDQVIIAEMRPMSKLKRWALKEILA